MCECVQMHEIPSTHARLDAANDVELGTLLRGMECNYSNLILCKGLMIYLLSSPTAFYLVVFVKKQKHIYI